jgi:glucokinase
VSGHQVVPPVVLAFDVGGTSIKAAAFDAAFDGSDLQLRGEPLAEARRPSPQGPAVLDAIVEAAEELRAALDDDQRGRVAAAGVAMLGLVDVAGGRARHSVNLDLHDLDVVTPLTERLGVPVALGHDVGAAGLAEYRVGSLRVDDPFVVVIGTGIAAVSFVDGRPITGSGGQAGEFGHVVVRPGGRECPCGGRGCLETVASAGAIARIYEERSGTPVAGALDVLARTGSDPVAAEVWDDATSALADGLLTVCALLAPGAIVLGGGLGEAGVALTGRVQAHLKERIHVGVAPPVLSATLGSRAGVIGAALIALDALDNLERSR